MDTVTYPDPTVRKVAAGFICIRAEYDHVPELVKEYGVKGLPDLRFLDPEGKELAKVRGFTSPAALAAKCQEVLDLLAGKAPVPTNPTPAPPVATVKVTPEAITAAVNQGTGFLKSAMDKGWPPAPAGMGPQDAVLYAWAASGVDASDEHLSKLLKQVLATPLVSTYQASFRAMALARLDTVGNRQGLEACGRFLTTTQLANGQWTYGPPTAGSQPPALGDNSNTTYALLGLAACRRAGVEIPPAVLERAEAWWRKAQNPDGGWGYRSDRETESYASMTESGVASLRLCQLLLGQKPDKDEAAGRALAWLGKHVSVSENLQSPYQQGRLLYHLYALERLGGLLGMPRLGDHDWYAEGAACLLGTQKSDGSWDDGADTPIPNTCFALLFLKRATASSR